MADEKVTVFARIKAKAGMEERLKQELLGLVEPTRAEEGCLNYDLHQSAADKTVFMFYENWSSRAALEQHSKSPHITAVRAKSAELLAEPTDLMLFDMVSRPE